MKSVAYQILRTYWNRPLIVVLGLAFLLVVALLIFGEKDGNVMQVGARPSRPHSFAYLYTESRKVDADERRNLETIPELKIRLAKKNKGLDSIRGMNLVRLDTEDTLPDLSEFNNLEYLDLNGFKLTPEDVGHILQLPKLRALILNIPKLPPGSLQLFGQKVTQLELLGLTLEAHADEASQMTAVKLLAINPFNASPKLLDVVTEVPQLKQLTILSNQRMTHSSARDNSTWSVINLDDSQLDLLRDHPTLNDVFANWHFMQHIKGFNDQALALKTGFAGDLLQTKNSGHQLDSHRHWTALRNRVSSTLGTFRSPGCRGDSQLHNSTPTCFSRHRNIGSGHTPLFIAVVRNRVTP